MKKELLSEIKRMKELAGIKILKENDETQAIANKVEETLPKVQDKLEDFVAKMSPQQKMKIQQDLDKLGIDAQTSPEEILNKIEGKVEDIVTENEETADPKSVKEKIGDVLHLIGSGNIAAWGGAPAALIIGGLGAGMPLGFAISWGATALLMSLAKLLGSKDAQ